MDFEEAAVLCGLGEKGLSGSILTRAFGPFQRWCFVLTDASLEPTPLAADRLCDDCRACVAACPGHAVEESGGRDVWQCGAYYRGACRAKNPFMPPNAFADLPDREKVMSGEARLTREESIQVMNDCYYYPPIKQGYAPSICGRACDRACYVHLEEQGKIERTFRTAFRRRPEWSLSLKDE